MLLENPSSYLAFAESTWSETDFLAEVEFDHLGTYRYSPEDGTAAVRLADHVPAEIARERVDRILELQDHRLVPAEGEGGR